MIDEVLFCNGRVSINHPDIFGGSEKLDLLWDKGLQDSNVVIAIRRPRPEWLSQQSFIIQVTVTPQKVSSCFYCVFVLRSYEIFV